MRKARKRALKAEFAKQFGREAEPMKLIGESKEVPGMISYVPSDIRRLKKAFLEARRG